MSAMKDYALGVCDAHPKEMYDLYDLLCGDTQAEEILQQACDQLEYTPVRADEERREVLDEIAAILAPLTHSFDREAMLGEVQGAAAHGTAFMEEELSYWGERLMRHEARAVAC